MPRFMLQLTGGCDVFFYDQYSPLFDELEKEALCLFQLRNALFIGVTKCPLKSDKSRSRAGEFSRDREDLHAQSEALPQPTKSRSLEDAICTIMSHPEFLRSPSNIFLRGLQGMLPLPGVWGCAPFLSFLAPPPAAQKEKKGISGTPRSPTEGSYPLHSRF